MDKQIIISIGRQYGSGGHEIARMVAQKLDLPLYDRNLLDEIANTKNVDSNKLGLYDETPRKRYFSRTVRGFTNSPEQNVAELQFALLKSKAADDDSFVVVGRCADEIFYGMDNFVSIFITADEKFRIERIMEVRGFDERKARHAIERHDKARSSYHNYFCKHGKWGECSTYDLSIDSSKLGLEGTADLIVDYVKKFNS